MDAIYFLTMVRHPAQRLASEFHHLKGGISCHGGWWRQFQPVLCANATERKAALLPQQTAPTDDPSPALAAYRQKHLNQRSYRQKHWNQRSEQARFEAWLSIPDNCAHNRMTRQLAPMGCAYSWAASPAFPTQQHRMLALARDTLSRRTLFGLTERYETSVRLINARLERDFAGHPLASVRLPLPLNTNTDRRAPMWYNISAAAMALIQRHNAQDLQLYAHAEQLFAQQLHEYRFAGEAHHAGAPASPQKEKY